MNKCPGQDKRKVVSESIICFSCGYTAEIFSDEIRVICSRCKNFIYKERLPTCLDWCKAARECIGEGKWKKIKG
jgi:hypothetical protein